MRSNKYSPDDPRVMACKRAIDAAGGEKRVSKFFGVTRQAVHQWEIVSIERCVAMEALSGVSVFDLRPDIFRKKERKAG